MKERRRAMVLAGIAVILFFLCLAAILPGARDSAPAGEKKNAYIYQDGELLTSIDLDEVEDVRFWMITSASGGTNRIEIRPGEIGISSADCPDQLCVKQGFVSDGSLPIVCLPHGLVIWVKTEDEEREGADAVVQ